MITSHALHTPAPSYTSLCAPCAGAGHAEEKAEKAKIESAKLAAAEKKRNDAEKEQLRKEREARDAKDLAARQQKRKSARIELSKLRK